MNLIGFGIVAAAVLSCDIMKSKENIQKKEFEKYGIYPGSYLQVYPKPSDSSIGIIYKVDKDTMTLSIHNSRVDCPRSEFISIFKVSADSICFASRKYRYAVSGTCLQPSDTYSDWPSSCTILRNIGPSSFEIYQHEETISGPGSIWAKLIRQ